MVVVVVVVVCVCVCVGGGGADEVSGSRVTCAIIRASICPATQKAQADNMSSVHPKKKTKTKKQKQTKSQKKT
jgi:hypothetical protein